MAHTAVCIRLVDGSLVAPGEGCCRLLLVVQAREESIYSGEGIERVHKLLRTIEEGERGKERGKMRVKRGQTVENRMLTANDRREKR